MSERWVLFGPGLYAPYGRNPPPGNPGEFVRAPPRIYFQRDGRGCSLILSYLQGE